METLFNQEKQNPEKNKLDKETIKLLNENIESLKKENARLRKENLELTNSKEEMIKLKPDKTFGLNVSGDVMLNKMEVEIIDTSLFQRLRFVNQLGSTNSAYPSANHTRFEHSLGVLNKADIMIQKIRSNKHSEPNEKYISLEEEQIIRLLALLHDIGHMPFGHTIEDEFNIFLSHDKHETRWQYFLGETSEIGKIIIRHHNKTFFDRFFRLIKCEKDFNGFGEDAFMYDIVSNTVCADLLDYLQRDCQYTNLKLNFHPRFLDYLVTKNVEDSDKFPGRIERRVVIRLCKSGSKEQRKDVQGELVQLLRNRFFLGERVYYHHAKIKTGTLIAGAVLRAKQSNSFKILEGFENKKYSIGDEPLYEIHTWGDVELLVNIKNLKSEQRQGKNPNLIEGAQSLADSYFNRRIYYQLHSYSKKELQLDKSIVKEIIDKKITTQKFISEGKAIPFELKLVNDFSDPISRLQFEETISEYLPDMKSGDFLIYFPNYKMQMKLAEVLIEEPDGTVNKLLKCRDEILTKECSEIIEKHQNIWRLRVFVHPRFIEPSGKTESDKQNAKEKYIQKFGIEYKTEYKTYLHIIEKYCKALFATNEEQKNYYEDFWKDIFTFTLDNKFDMDENPDIGKIYNPQPNREGKKSRTTIIAELAAEFSGDTMAKRSYPEILEKLESRFKENFHK